MPSLISSIKEMLLEKKGKKESEVDNQLCGKEKDAYKKQWDDRQYERNRQNIKNITKKIQKLEQEFNIVKEDILEDDY